MATSKEIRIQNLQSLVREFGTMIAVAQRADTSAMYLSQVLNGSKSSSGTPRGVGDALARKLEMGCGKIEGWMDKDHFPSQVSWTRITGASGPGGSVRIESSTEDDGDVEIIGKRAIPVLREFQVATIRKISDPYTPGEGFDLIHVDEGYSEMAFAMELAANSMMPDYLPGDTLVIEPDWRPNPGDCVVAIQGGEHVTFKKYRQRGTDQSGKAIFELVPLNEDYPTLKSDETELEIIGVLAEFRRKVRRR